MVGRAPRSPRAVVASLLASPLARFSDVVAADRLDATKRDEPAVARARRGIAFQNRRRDERDRGGVSRTILARVGALRSAQPLRVADAGARFGGRRARFASRGGRGGARGRPPADDAGVGARAPGERHARSGWGWRQGREPGNADVSRERASSSSASSSGENDAPQRVSKLLAWRGLCSRREAEELIARGAVTVDGIVVSQGDKARPGARIEVSSDVGREWLRGKVTVVLNKPVGSGQQLPLSLERPRRAPSSLRETPTSAETTAPPMTIGPPPRRPREISTCAVDSTRTRGLLVLTQDGALRQGHHLWNEIPKTYEVEVDRDVTEAQLRMLNGPVTLEGARLLPMRVEPSVAGAFGSRSERAKATDLVVCEGANLRVVDLLRVSVGSCTLGNLPEGTWRLMTTDERDGLRELGARGGGGGGRRTRRRRQGRGQARIASAGRG